MRVLCRTTSASSCSLATGALKSNPAIVLAILRVTHSTGPRSAAVRIWFAGHGCTFRLTLLAGSLRNYAGTGKVSCDFSSCGLHRRWLALFTAWKQAELKVQRQRSQRDESRPREHPEPWGGTAAMVTGETSKRKRGEQGMTRRRCRHGLAVILP